MSDVDNTGKIGNCAVCNKPLEFMTFYEKVDGKWYCDNENCYTPEIHAKYLAERELINKQQERRYQGKHIKGDVVIDGYTIPRYALTESTYGQRYCYYNLLTCILLAVRFKCCIDKNKELEDKAIELLSDASFRRDMWLEALELDMMCENMWDHERPMLKYRLHKAKQKLIKRTGLYEGMTLEEHWSSYAGHYGSKLTVVDLFAMTMEKLENMHDTSHKPNHYPIQGELAV